MCMRQGDSGRDIAESGLMGRQHVAAALRTLAHDQGWLARAIALLCISPP
jgi:hypothetical protein